MVNTELQITPSSDSPALPIGEPLANPAFDSGLHSSPLGSSGTEVFGGYFTEEYLQKLRGTRGAKVFDEMRRSDAQVTMLLSSVMNPIKSATWEFEAFEPTPEFQKHADFMTHNLKDKIDFETFMHEMLTLLPFGYSLFEVIHDVVFNHPKFGTFNGLNSLAFRSQKTIERWNLERRTGKLLSVDQFVYNDIGQNVTIPGEFLLVFTNHKEGDNYEGISALRAMYGPWIRKTLYQKLTAIGLEKHALGMVIGTIPAGKEKSEEATAFKAVLKKYMSHELAFITKPEGWEIDIKTADFDATKIKEIILLENTEMINALVANFLALGMNGNSGAFALGSDLSDFFTAGIQSYANLASGAINRGLTPKLIDMNFGPQPGYPKLKCTGISDEAGKELADVVKLLLDSGAMESDAVLEADLRKRFKLPKKDPTTVRAKPAPVAAAPAIAPQLAERMKLAETAGKQIKNAKPALRDMMQTELRKIADRMKDDLRKAYVGASGSDKITAASKVTPVGEARYAGLLADYLAEQAQTAIIMARKAVPAKVRNVKLADTRLSALPPAVRKLVQTQAQLIAATQLGDLDKIMSFQFTSSATSSEDVDAILHDVESKIGPTLQGGTAEGMSIDVAAADALAHVIQQSRAEFFFSDEVVQEIESFTLVNDDPISEICQELEGTTLAADDPDLQRYWTPLHHNCKSSWQPNGRGASGNPEIQDGAALSRKALDSITLSESQRIFTRAR